MARSARWWTLSIIIFGFGCLYFLGPMLAPFITAAVFAYMANPLVNRLVKLKLPRSLAVLIIFVLTLILLFLLSLLLLPPLEKQIRILINKLPEVLAWLQVTAIPWISEKFDVEQLISLQGIQDAISTHWQQAGNFIQQTLITITRSGLSLLGFLVNFVLVFVVAFYLLRDWDAFVQGIEDLLPRRIAGTVIDLTKECNEVLGAFFRGQLLVMLCIGTIYTVGLSFIGLDLALLIGLVAGIITFIPYLGFAVGLIAGLIAAFFQFHDSIHLLYVFIVFGIGNMLEGMVLSPLLVGERIGLHPVAVIFAVLAGGQLFGFVGVLLALPVAAVIMVLLRFVKQHYVQSELYAPIDVDA